MKYTILNPIYGIVLFFMILAQSVFAQQLMFDGESKRTLALVIGISNYEHLNDLQFAHKDAEDFEHFLTAKNGLNLPKSNVTVFTNEKATQSNIMYNGFEWLNDELKEGDEAFIFFSGHGDIYNKDDIDILKTGYLLTFESEEDKYETTAVPLESFLKQIHIISNAKKANIKVILDVCHAGIGFKSGGIISLLEIANQYDPNKEIIITSCRADEYSWEYEELQNGCFTYFLMEGLKGAADKNNDLQITLRELQSYATSNVNRYVEIRDNSYQFPEFKGNNSHRLALIDGKYQQPPLPIEADEDGESKGGIKKGLESNAKNNAAEVNELLEKLDHKDVSSQEIETAYKLYLEQPEKKRKQRAVKRKMKRDLVAIMIEKADKDLTHYFDEEDEMMKSKYHVPVSEYYLKSAKLLGEDHFLYNELIAKYFFVEALSLKTLDHEDDAKVIDKLNSSLTLEPTASYTLNELGNVYFERGEYEKAFEYYQKANKISPTWGKNLIKTNKILQQKKTAQNNSLTNSLSNPSPTPYDLPFNSKIGSASGNNQTNAVSQIAKDKVYHIQLAAASKVNRDEFKKVEDLGPINPEFNPEKNLINTWMGPFDTEKEAKLKLKKAKERGFKDAFLVATTRDSSFQKKLDEKKAVLKKELAATMPYQVRIASVKNYNKSEFAKLDHIGEVEVEPVSVNGKSLFRVLIRYNFKDEAVAGLQSVKKQGFKDAYLFENNTQLSKNNPTIPSSYDNATNPISYKIRVATVSKLVENQFANLEDLGQIYMDVVHESGLIRISVGDYSSKIKATEVLNKIKKRGYKDAFIQIVK